MCSPEGCLWDVEPCRKGSNDWGCFRVELGDCVKEPEAQEVGAWFTTLEHKTYRSTIVEHYVLFVPQTVEVAVLHALQCAGPHSAVHR